CIKCHVAKYITGKSSMSSAFENQVIFPYTDLLLHDMGADLADVKLDGKPASKNVLSEFSATAHEWRTPPLWGLGLAKTIDPKASFLHDGRARTIMEAILWHGGEAKASQEKVLGLSRSERESLLAFLNDL
ncbi:MAG: di-heme oxidoredictase family protein, partial [Pseudomonadota bacterium]